MFKSFFPNPRWFFISLIVWFIVNLSLWYSGGSGWGSWIGFPAGYAEADLVIGVSRFWSPAFLWFYLWFFVSTCLFALFWRFFLTINGSVGRYGDQHSSCLTFGLVYRSVSL
jgi:peptide/bleomycin uptake transporter